MVKSQRGGGYTQAEEIGYHYDRPGHQAGSPVTNAFALNHSRQDVKKAGELIACHLVTQGWDQRDSATQEVIEAFRIANAWRDAHAYPMRSIRSQLVWYQRTIGISGAIGARLKRMQAIRRKLARNGPTLVQLQDLAGCRAILPSMRGVDILTSILKDRSRHLLWKQNDYITEPKGRDGYRSRHLIFEYKGQGDAKVYDDKRVEVQIRTELQHSWATAVEAIGLFRNEDLKGNRGDEKWLRLFKLMSGEFAAFEGCPEVPGLCAPESRREEIRDLNADLNAVQTLENLRFAVQWTNIAVPSPTDPAYYLIKYDNASNQVEVRPFFDTGSAVESYDIAERSDNESGREETNVVLVHSEKLADLKRAYPNYFGDVQLFCRNLKGVVGKARDYKIIPQDSAPPAKPEPRYDLRWLRYRGRWK